MKTKMPKFELYKDKAREWRWRLKAGNGRIIAVSSESYKRHYDILVAIQLVRGLTQNTPIYELCPSTPQPSQQGRLT